MKASMSDVNLELKHLFIKLSRVCHKNGWWLEDNSPLQSRLKITFRKHLSCIEEGEILVQWFQHNVQRFSEITPDSSLTDWPSEMKEINHCNFMWADGVSYENMTSNMLIDVLNVTTLKACAIYDYLQERCSYVIAGVNISQDISLLKIILTVYYEIFFNNHKRICQSSYEQLRFILILVFLYFIINDDTEIFVNIWYKTEIAQLTTYLVGTIVQRCCKNHY